MSGVGLVEITANDSKLGGYYSEWMKGIDDMYRKVCESFRKNNAVLDIMKSGYRSSYKNACRAAEEGDRKGMKKYIKRMNTYHVILSTESLPMGKAKRVLRHLPEE